MKTSMLLLIILLAGLIVFSGCTGKSYKEKECEDKTTSEEKGNCYLNFAVQDRDLQYCEQIEYKSIKENCQTKTAEAKINYCIAQAVAKQDGSVCRDCCMKEFGMSNSDNTAQCALTCTLRAGFQGIA